MNGKRKTWLGRGAVAVCLGILVALAGCGGGGAPGAGPGSGPNYVNPAGVSVQTTNPSALQVINFSPVASGTGVMLGLWASPLQSVAWSIKPSLGSSSFPIAYANLATNNLYAVYPDNPNVTVQITKDTTQERFPAWNYNSTYLAYTANNHIYKIKANGSGVVQLTNRTNLDNGRPEWSPDGTKIAFNDSSSGGSALDIWVMNANGSGLTNLTGGKGANQSPSWTPDGMWIVWSRQMGTGGFHLWEMAANGMDAHQITNFGSSSQEIQPCVSPTDPNSIVFTQVIGSSQQIASTTDGGASSIPLTTKGVNQWPAFDPTGTRIAFQSNRFGEYDIFVTNITGQPQTDLTPLTGNEETPTWKTFHYYRVPLGAAGTDAGFNPRLGTSASAILATSGSGGGEFTLVAGQSAYYVTCAVNATSGGTVTLTPVGGSASSGIAGEGLIDVQASTSLIINEDLFRGVMPTHILGGINPWVPGTIQRVIVGFDPVSGQVAGVLSFAGTVTASALQLGPAPKPYTVTHEGSSTVIRGNLAGLWTAATGYRTGIRQVTIDARGRITAS